MSYITFRFSLKSCVGKSQLSKGGVCSLVTFQESGEIVKLWQNPTRFTPDSRKVLPSSLVILEHELKSKRCTIVHTLICTKETKILKPESIDMVIFNIQPQTYVQ
jgi:hypothetical protein